MRISRQAHSAESRTDDFACETLFDVLRKVGKTSAGMGRRDYTGNRLLGRFADYSTGGEAVSDAEVEAVMKNVVSAHLPDFLICQYGETDDVFHSTGPFSAEAGEAVAAADAWLARWVSRLTAKDYGILVLADHGQHEKDRPDGTKRGSHGQDRDEDRLVPFCWTR